ncbi:MAG TPA: protein kinase [Flavisolibacter sp.]
MAKVFTITEGLENMGALKTGGQGSVYKARRHGPIITAVKLMPTPVHSENPNDKNYIDFQNEVQKLKKVNEEPNPNVVKIVGSGITDTGGFPFIEMEFIEGPDLEDLLRPPRDPIFTIKEAIKVADHLSHALAHCHKVDVKHGDIKSNNVKLNVHTGNYVLLDFGLALMSDEQRRTSLRQAGAMEFMAPEQNDELMLFQTDVYSFGIILYELLAGTVPFPLTDRTENARNLVRAAHMETPPPDLLELRRKHLPASWSDEKKEREMQVPYWLTSLIAKCLEKKPENRFTNGMELHDYIVMNSTLAAAHVEAGGANLSGLQYDNDRLLREKQQIQGLLTHYQQTAGSKEQELISLRNSLEQKEKELAELRRKDYVPYQTPAERKGVSPTLFIFLLLFTVGLAAFGAYAWFLKDKDPQEETTAKTPADEQEVTESTSQNVIGQYKVLSSRAYFHNKPDGSTRRTAYMVPSNEVVNAFDEANGFIYTEFTNNKGQTSKGWLKKEDLITLEEWEQKQVVPDTPVRLTKIQINELLQQAKGYIANNNTAEALAIYKTLAGQDVPEAMYQYGNLALQNRNNEIDCAAALDYMSRASAEGNTDAKRTLGLLYLFGDNRQALQTFNYDRCTYEKNVVRGTQLLMEAALAGDSTASEILEDFRNSGGQ